MGFVTRVIQLIISFLIALALLLSSCNFFKSGDEGSDTPDHQTTLEFDPRLFREKEFLLSRIADDISYVPLDNDILIKESGQIKLINNSVYIGNYETPLVKFTIEGKNPQKIGNIGRGPEEYLGSDI